MKRTIGSPEGISNVRSKSVSSFWPLTLRMDLLMERNCFSWALVAGTMRSTFSLTMNESLPAPGIETRLWRSCLGSRAAEKAIS